jgi:hypothetical protein
MPDFGDVFHDTRPVDRELIRCGLYIMEETERRRMPKEHLDAARAMHERASQELERGKEVAARDCLSEIWQITHPEEASPVEHRFRRAFLRAALGCAVTAGFASGAAYAYKLQIDDETQQPTSEQLYAYGEVAKTDIRDQVAADGFTLIDKGMQPFVHDGNLRGGWLERAVRLPLAEGQSVNLILDLGNCTITIKTHPVIEENRITDIPAYVQDFSTGNYARYAYFTSRDQLMVSTYGPDPCDSELLTRRE